MRDSNAKRFVLVGSAALALGVLASAQTAPPPERPKAPTSPPSTTPPPARPQTPATTAVRPHATDALAVTLTEDTIQFYKDANFKDTVVQVDGISKSNPANAAAELKEGLEDSLSSLRWNLPAGVVVVIYEDDGTKGEQFVLFGSGQVDSMAKFDFDNKASQWAWFYAGGASNPPAHIKSGSPSIPLGAEPASSSVPDNALQLFKSKDFEANTAVISNVTSQPMGKLNTLPQDLPDSLTSLRWNVPAGTVVMFYQTAEGLKQRVGIWGNGEIADLDIWDFNDKASRWAWYNIGGSSIGTTPGAPTTPNTPGGRGGH